MNLTRDASGFEALREAIDKKLLSSKTLRREVAAMIAAHVDQDQSLSNVETRQDLEPEDE